MTPLESLRTARDALAAMRDMSQSAADEYEASKQLDAAVDALLDAAPALSDENRGGQPPIAFGARTPPGKGWMTEADLAECAALIEEDDLSGDAARALVAELRASRASEAVLRARCEKLSEYQGRACG